jgi:hypothetical protein
LVGEAAPSYASGLRRQRERSGQFKNSISTEPVPVGNLIRLAGGGESGESVNRLGLPAKLSRSLACANSIENVMGFVRRVCRNVRRWRNAGMALRWTAAGMLDAAKGFRRLKAYKQLPALRAALIAHQTSYTTRNTPEESLQPAWPHQ